VDDLAAEVPLACVTRRGANVGPAGEALLDSIRAAANSTRTTRKPQTH
jgi:hypothetical protein